MPTIIDELVVTLGLDPSKFTEGQKKVAEAFLKTKRDSERVAKEMERRGGQAADFFKEIRNQAASLFALFEVGRGVKEFIQAITRSDIAVGRLSFSLGMSSRTLSAWQLAAKDLGGTAEGVSQAFQSISSDLQNFVLTGESRIMPYLTQLGINPRGANGVFKTPDQILMDLANSQRLQRMDPRMAAQILQNMGIPQDLIYILLHRRGELQNLLKQEQANAPTGQDVNAALDRARAYQQLDNVLTKLGRDVLTQVTPYMDGFLDHMRQWIQLNPQLAQMATVTVSLGTALTGLATALKLLTATGLLSTLSKTFLPFAAFAATVMGSDALLKMLEASKDTTKGGVTYGTRNGVPFATVPIRPQKQSNIRNPGVQKQSYLPNAEVENYLVQSAYKHGIDPRVVLGVYHGEGARGYVGDYGSSFGPFQLHYGGIAGGGNRVAGLGDLFTQQTGLDARDPSTWRAQIDWSLAYARTHGWGPWHGWRGLPFAGIMPQQMASASRGASLSTAHVQIGSIVVNTQATDARGIASDIGKAVEREAFVASANPGAV